MPFIVSSDIEKADPDTRRLIRSYVRRGRGKKRGTAGRRGRHSSEERVRLDQVVNMYTPSIPSRIGSDYSPIGFEFADGIEPATLLNVAKSLY